MECDRCLEEMSAWLDGELPSPSEQEMRLHLAACARCASEHADLESAFAWVEANAAAVAVRPETWQQVRSRIATAEPPEPAGAFQGIFGMRRWIPAAAALAATAALAFGFWGYLRYDQSSRQLQKYMDSYIEQREAALAPALPGPEASSSPKPPRREAAAVRTDFPGDSNPFMEVDSTPYANPFRTEAR